MATTVTLKPNAIDISGSTSGTTTLQASAVAGTTTVTLPATTGTVITSGDTGTVTNTMLAGSIANAKLSNSSVTIGGTAIALGASSSTITNDLTISGQTVGKGGGSVSTNTAHGVSALNANTTGSENTAVGYNSGVTNTTGTNNSFFGRFSGYYSTGSYNTALGNGVLNGASGLTTGSYNTGVGSSALGTLTSGAENTAVGSSKSGSYNAALGQLTTGSFNVAVGNGSLQSNTTASYSVAVGYQAGYANTTGNITAFGSKTLYSNTTGTDNTAVGGNYNASAPLYANTTGSYNIALGTGALTSNTTASNNTAVGYQAGYTNSTGNQSVYVGYQAGYLATANYNAIVGNQAGYNTTGAANSFFGSGAGYYVTSGAKNTVIGGYTGNQGGLDIRTSSNYIVLSDGDGNPRGVFNGRGDFALSLNPSTWTAGNAVEVGTGIGIWSSGASSLDISSGVYYNGGWKYANSSYKASVIDMPNGGTVQVYTVTSTGTAGNAATLTAGPYVANGGTSWTNSSDERLKNITGEIQNGLDKVCTLRAAEFTWKDDESAKPCVGLIAQDVEKVLPEVISKSKRNFDDETEYLGVTYTEVVSLLVAAIKELKAEVDSLKQQLGK